MSHSIRFLGVAVLAWAGVRAASLGLLPGTSALARELPPPPPVAADTPAAALPVEPTIFAPLEPVAPPGSASLTDGTGPAIAYLPFPAGPAAGSAAWRARSPAPGVRPARYASLDLPSAYATDLPAEPWLEPAPMARLASAGHAARTGTSAPTFDPPADSRPRLDRVSLSTWAYLRSPQGTPGLATTGSLGGSQAGARLLVRATPKLAASLRFASAAGGPQGAEAALGVRWQPIASVPVAFTVERRQAIGRYGGRSDFALFAEGGVYDRPLPWRTRLDAYVQAGVVGHRARDLFVDGGATLTRPLWKGLSGGIGVWGGAQPGLWRVDAGPRLSVKVHPRVRMHADWRQQLGGNALPGSGAALTVAADF